MRKPDDESFHVIVNRFLDNACPDHHVRGVSDHARASSTAMRLLERFPHIATANFHTAVVCGDIELLRRMLANDASLATQRDVPDDPRREDSGSENDLYRDLGSKGWDALLHLCFTRLPLEAVERNAVDIARLLLDHGADPNAYFRAGDSKYTPMVGVVGEGEEDRPPHPRRDELVQLLLDRGANPYDTQVVYNTGFNGDVLWFLKMIHAHSVRVGRATDWDDPEWQMLGMGGYGTGARWFLEIAVRTNNLELARWCLAHGANPATAPKRDQRFSQQSLYAWAVKTGRDAIADLLLEFGAEREDVVATSGNEFVDVCLRLDRTAVQQLAGENPRLLEEPDAIFKAASDNRADVVAMLLDLGVSPNIENEHHERPLHTAAYNSAIDVIRLLIARGADIDPVEPSYHNTPLGAAMHSGSEETRALLASCSRDIWQLVWGGFIDRVREVLAREPQLARVETGNGHTPLMWLPTIDESLAIDMAKLLMSHGADGGKVNSARETAATRARALGMYDLAGLLAGKDPTKTE